MKSLVKWAVARVVNHDLAWQFVNATIVRAGDYARMKRRELLGINEMDERDAFIASALHSISPDLIVRHGPFKGLRYPEGKSIGSTLAPKIVGSYERELSSITEAICSRPYTEIVDIGCAEGYYAVGLAMRVSTAHIYAFDTDERAITSCMTMAQLNHVEDRVSLGAFCDSAALSALPFTKRALIISDCEGYEKELFTETVIAGLARHDLLIEVHDFMDIEISRVLRQRFARTHHIESVRSVDDITKAHTYEYPELDEYTLEEKRQLLAEGRPSIMEWLFMTPVQRSV